jgi:hypothetical protein
MPMTAENANTDLRFFQALNIANVLFATTVYRTRKP